MKPKTIIIGLLLLAALFTVPAFAQPLPRVTLENISPPPLPPNVTYVTNYIVQVQVPADAVTNTLPGPTGPLAGALANIQNIDTNATIFAKDSMELRIGAVSQGITGTSFDSSLGLSYYFKPNFGAGIEIVNGRGGIESANLTLELRKPIGNFCIAGFMGGGRNLSDSVFQGIAGVRLSYSIKPSSRMFTYAESALVVSKGTINKPTTRFALGIGYAF